LFPKSRKLAYDARQQLSQVQNNLISASDLYASLDELQRQLDLLEQLLSRETPAQREIWRRKILELRDDSSSLRRQGEYYSRMVNSNLRVQREREELLTRRRRRREVGMGDADSEMQDYAEESQSLASSQNMVGELLMSGQAQLSSLVDQRRRMRGVKRMVLNIGNTIGLSQNTIKMIEKRDENDMYLVFFGMVITCIVIYVVWFR
jgi:Golgi SNAP receptor complex protein 2